MVYVLGEQDERGDRYYVGLRDHGAFTRTSDPLRARYWPDPASIRQWLEGLKDQGRHAAQLTGRELHVFPLTGIVGRPVGNFWFELEGDTSINTKAPDGSKTGSLLGTQGCVPQDPSGA